MTMHQRDGGFIGLVLASAIALTACGGGGSGNGDENTTAGEDANSAPSITSQGEVSVAENTALVLDVAASDADGDTLSFSLSGADAGALGGQRERGRQQPGCQAAIQIAETPNRESGCGEEAGDRFEEVELMQQHPLFPMAAHFRFSLRNPLRNPHQGAFRALHHPNS